MMIKGWRGWAFHLKVKVTLYCSYLNPGSNELKFISIFRSASQVGPTEGDEGEGDEDDDEEDGEEESETDESESQDEEDMNEEGMEVTVRNF